MWIRPCLALCEALAVSLFALQGCALTEGSEHPTSPQQRSSVLTESHSLYCDAASTKSVMCDARTDDCRVGGNIYRPFPNGPYGRYSDLDLH